MSETSVQEKIGVSKGVSKKRAVCFSLIALAVVLIIAGAVIGGSFIIPKSITGTWELVVNPETGAATADEISESERVYYVFDKADRYGRGDGRLCYQGGVEPLKYELLEEDKVQKINLGALDMEYIIKGSKLLGNAELTLIYPEYTDESTGTYYEAQEYIFEQAKNIDYEKMPYKDYETDSNLLGELWTSNERSLAYFYYGIPYTQSVEFTDKGIMIIHYESEELFLDRYMYYAYTAENKELTFSLVTDKETKYTVAYDFDENGNLKFAKDVTSSSMFSDAIFGDFTFYTEENLPEPTTGALNDELYFSE